MAGPSSCLQAILFIVCWGLAHASNNNTSPCSDTTDPQPIAINLSLDTVTAACVPSIDQWIPLAGVYSGGSSACLPNYSKVTSLLRWNYYQERRPKPQRHSSLFSNVYSLRDALFGSKCPIADEELSSDQIKFGFLEAFEVIKHLSWTNERTNITSALILFPPFFSPEVRELVIEASQEAGIMPTFPPISPHTLLATLEPNILDDEITAVNLAAKSHKLLIIDYGAWQFDIRTRDTRCKLRFPLESMGCMNLNHRLTKRVISTNMDIQQQLDQGGSDNTLSSAIWQSRLLMKAERDVESWDEEASEGELPHKWPLKLDDWWIGQKKEAFLYWEDIETTEAEYISVLAEGLNNLLTCIQDEAAETEHESKDFDQIIILGNACDRSVIARVVRQSVGEHARIIGANSEADVFLEALAGARFAFTFHEAKHNIQAYRKSRLPGGHEEL
ncbi:uncharacterized protein N7500_007880 [Penicillium coprophilum]|uniref:uncharacterized protein n=1 Tax=Penicillium coprophilum TaxID=36646 RepID=UPI002383881B|nr:uncharacterized protein N7500_007880 [Penicillium coprophilum]KAJ5158229.1 hypothetical protein N7500_007880 [Penicillium coprophilum]